MHLIIGRTHRNPGCSTSGRGMTRAAFCVSGNEGYMITAMSCPSVAGDTGSSHSARRIMMNRAGRIGGGRMTGQAGCQPFEARGVTEEGATIGKSYSEAATQGIHMAIYTVACALMSGADYVSTSMTIATVAGPNEISRLVTTMGGGICSMTIKTSRRGCGHDNIRN